MAKNLSRRDFLKGAAASAVGIASLGVVGTSFAEEAPAAESAVVSEDWLGSAPGITDDMCAYEKSADVVVVGAGVAGVAAARSAAENGASVIVLEQAEMVTARGMVFGCVDSSLHKKLGCSYNNMEIVNAMQKRNGNRTNAALWKRWADQSGAAYDWYIEPLNGEDMGQFLEYWPNPEKYNRDNEYYPQYCSGIEFTTENWIRLANLNAQAAMDKGAEFLFACPAVELCKVDGKITGVYAKDAEDKYFKVSCSKGVILATGDYGANEAMVKALCPEFYHNCGITAIGTSTGYGHRMAIWAGGMMEVAPHAHMCHSFPSMGLLGTTAALQLNKKGLRYMNEDVPGQSFTNQVSRQPGKVGYQIFDANWAEMIDNQNISHGAVDVNFFNPEATQAMLDGMKGIVSWNGAGADTLEELFGLLGLPVETAMKSVERYNELCEKGVDEDFGKRGDRMYPIKTGPFYAGVSFIAAGVITAGVVVNNDCMVVDANFDPIPNLWAIGNVGGGRYAIDYPVNPVAATSHGTAITFGRYVGKMAAEL